MNKGARFFRFILDISIGRNILTKDHFITIIINEGITVVQRFASDFCYLRKQLSLVLAVAFFRFMIKLILDPEHNRQKLSENLTYFLQISLPNPYGI